MERLYQAFDSFVFPSRFEGLGIVAIEAQAAGLPTVCSDSVPQFANATDLFTTMPLSASSKEWAETVMDRINIGSRKGRSQELMDAGYDVNKVSVELIELYGNMIGGGGGGKCFSSPHTVTSLVCFLPFWNQRWRTMKRFPFGLIIR